MAEIKTVSIVPLCGKNYPTWKVQCKMALMKEGLWGIASGAEAAPVDGGAEATRKFELRRDRALAIIVLSVEPSLLYLIPDPEKPVDVWTKLRDQFQKKTWANKLELRRRLYSLRLKEGEPVQEHVRAMTEVFEALSVVGDPLEEEDRVVYLLASLPDSFSMLVTALEASPEVPAMELVTERLLHEERKMKERQKDETEEPTALAARWRKGKCYHCGKVGHFKRDCRKFAQLQGTPGSGKHSAHKAGADYAEGSDSEAMMVIHAQSATTRGSWIIDSGATCHMCNDEQFFVNLNSLRKPQEVTLGDGHVLEAIGEGTVPLRLCLPGGGTKKCDLQKVLFVPKLSYNLLSVSKASEAGKTIKFNDSGCEILNGENKVIGCATRVGSLYYLELRQGSQQLYVAEEENKERLWHRRYGHLSKQGLQRLATNKLVEQFDYKSTSDIGFCETCIEAKHHRGAFENSTSHTKKAARASALQCVWEDR